MHQTLRRKFTVISIASQQIVGIFPETSSLHVGTVPAASGDGSHCGGIKCSVNEIAALELEIGIIVFLALVFSRAFFNTDALYITEDFITSGVW